MVVLARARTRGRGGPTWSRYAWSSGSPSARSWLLEMLETGFHVDLLFYTLTM